MIGLKNKLGKNAYKGKIACYLRITATSNKIQPTRNIKPPMGVKMPIPETPTLFIAFNEDNKYKDPEKSTIPNTKKAPDQFSKLRDKRSERIPTINKAKA